VKKLLFNTRYQYFCIGIAIITAFSCNSPKQDPSMPNILFILADDLGYSDLSCFGSPYIHTPNLDALASEGMIFTDFHSNCSVCSPTRVALMTGRYQHRTGIVNVLGQTSKALPLIQGLPKSSTNIARVLRDNGYQTAIFGKWHLGNFREYHPLEFGFDYFFGVSAGLVGDPFEYTYGKAGPNSRSTLYRNREHLTGRGEYITYRLADELVEYIDRRDQEKPFFIFLPFTAPHLPYWKPGDSLLVWDGNPKGPHPDNLDEAYKETIEALDLAVGNIMEKIRETGLGDNTLVFFTSDNGPVKEESSLPYTGRKSTLYEGGTRVPGIAWWPGRIKPGQVSNELITTMDIFPTLVNLAEIRPVPELNFDGIDCSGVMLENSVLPERMVFWEKPAGVYMDHFDLRREAVRQGKWKLLRERSGEDLQLFDLDTDTAEQFDLSGEYPEKVQELYSAFLKWKEEVYSDAPMDLDAMLEYLEENGILK
jgi:arylsulfatase A-like enzyme